MPFIWKCMVHSCCDAWFTVQWRSFDRIFCGSLTPLIHKLSLTQRQLHSENVLIIQRSLNRFQGNQTQVAKAAASNQTLVLSFHGVVVSANINHVHFLHWITSPAIQQASQQGKLSGGINVNKHVFNWRPAGVYPSFLRGECKSTSWTSHQFTAASHADT